MKRVLFLPFIGSFLLISGNLHSQRMEHLNDSLLFHLSKQNYTQAYIYVNKMKPLISQQVDPGSETYRDFWWNAGTCFKNLGRETELFEALEYVEKWFVLRQQKNQPDYGLLCLEKGLFYGRTGKFALSESYISKARELLRAQQSAINHGYISATHAMATLYMIQKKWYQSELLFDEIFKLAKKGGYYNNIIGIIQSYGQLKIEQGEFGAASDIFFMLLMDPEKSAGLTGKMYFDIIMDLSSIQHSMGLYFSAISLLGNAAISLQKKFGTYQELFWKLLAAMGDVHMSEGQLKVAETYFDEVLLIVGKMYGSESPVVVEILLKKVSLLNKSLKPNQALAALQPIGFFFDEARIKANQRIYSKYLLEKGNANLLLKKFKTADSCFTTAKDIVLRNEGDSSLNYYTIRNQQARLFFEQKENFQAIVVFSEINQLQSKYWPRRHPVIDQQWEKEILMYEEFAEYGHAASTLMAYSGTKVNQIREAFRYFSEYEKNVFLDHCASLLDHINSSAFLYPTSDEVFLESRYLMNAALKSLTLSDTYRMLKKARNSSNPSVIARLRKIDSLKNWLQYQYSLEPSKRSSELPWKRLQSDFIEKSLRKEPELMTEQDVFEADFEINAFKKNMKESEIAIEFVRFRLRRNEWTDSVIYAAYVLRKDDKMPVFVPLFEERQLLKIFDSAGSTATNMVSNLYRGSSTRNKSSSSFLGKELYQLIWIPLEPYLEGIKNISYAPAGKLNAISFQALTVDSTAVLSDKYSLVQYNSTRAIALRQEQPEIIKPGSIALFGDAAFTTDRYGSSRENEKNNVTGNSYTEKNRGQRGQVWSDLPGTIEEVNRIKKLFEEKGISTMTFMQNNATENNFKSLSGNAPKILHIATHGFSFPEPPVLSNNNDFNHGNWFASSEDPLLRNGLVLTGGNDVWKGKTPVEGTEDGVATSYEISQLNLSNTELVVLSACETALGDIKGSEGVFGLQRAFKMAGVKKMIVSLWQVPDKETAELMTAFYGYWLKGKTINEAFAQAQAEMRKKYSPYYWAAFVLVE